MFKHGQHPDPMDGELATVIARDERFENLWVIEFGDGDEGLAFADELTLPVPVKKPAPRDLGALYREMQKDLMELWLSTCGDPEAMSAWLVDRGWDKKL